MRSAAHAFHYEYDEVSVSSLEVVEADVAAIRHEQREHKADFREFKAEVHAEFKLLRERVDRNFDLANVEFKEIRAEFKEVHKAISDLTKVVLKIDNRLSAIIWVGSGLIALITLAITVGKALHWF